MLFNSLTFLIFLPIVLALYHASGHRRQNLLLLVASLFFYACWDWRFVFLLLATAIVDFYIATYLYEMAQKGIPQERRRRVLYISMFCNLAVLGFFKYFNFFASSVETTFHAIGINLPISTLNIVLPIGVSFYTFQSMSYTIDVYHGELPPAKSVWDFLLFVSFFPHLVAGPIMRAVDLLPQILRPRVVTRAQVYEGLHLMMWGFWKKVFIADNLAPMANTVFAQHAPDGFHTLMGVYAFAFQIYGDFSGYTDIARGVAKLMGFELTLNFNLPYFSTSPKEFWTRWHISLSSWLRNYLYVPLGGNRGGVAKTYRNLMATMVLGGLWHGAAWTFVLWGFYQGALLVVHRLLEPVLTVLFAAKTKIGNGFSFAVRVLIMFHLTCFGWLLFRATSFAQVTRMTQALLHPLQGFDKAMFMQVAWLTGPLLLIEAAQYASRNQFVLESDWLLPEIKTVCYSVLLYLTVFRAAQPQAFIYFQF